MDKKAIIELLKSTGRFVWFGLIGLLGVALTALAADPAIIGAVIDIAGLKLSLGVVILAVVSFIVKAIDKYVHENKNTDLNGIAPPFLQK